MIAYSTPQQLLLLERMCRIRAVIDSYPANGATSEQVESLYEDLYSLAQKLQQTSTELTTETTPTTSKPS